MSYIIALINSLPSRLSRITKSGSFIPEIDGLRFLAIMPVIVQHVSERLNKNYPEFMLQALENNTTVYYASRGTIGVYIFFAISGFILSLPFAKQARMNNFDLKIGKYLTRRFTRIEPPYIFWMSVFFIVLVIRSPLNLIELTKHWLASVFYIHNIVFQEYSIINPIAWSLEIEIQFYLLAPFLAIGYFAIKDDFKRRLGLILSILMLICFQHYFGWVHSPFKMTLVGQFHYFLIGFLMTDLYLSGFLKKKHLFFDALGAISFYLLLITWSEEFMKNIAFSLFLLLLLVSGFKGILLNKIFTNKWVTAFGGMCYTIYLIHLPLLELQFKLSKYLIHFANYEINLLIQMLIGLPLIIVASSFFYLIIEKPCMKPDFWRLINNRFFSRKLITN